MFDYFPRSGPCGFRGLLALFVVLASTAALAAPGGKGKGGGNGGGKGGDNPALTCYEKPPRGNSSKGVEDMGIVYLRVPSTLHPDQYDEPPAPLLVPTVDGGETELKKFSTLDRLPDARRITQTFSGPGELVYRHKCGGNFVDDVLYSCMNPDDPTDACMPVDPAVSFDGTQVAFAVLFGGALEQQRYLLSGQPAKVLPNVLYNRPSHSTIFVYELSSGKVTEPRQPANAFNMSPRFLPQGGLVFTSTEGGLRPPTHR